MTGRIQALRDKLPELAAEEETLRSKLSAYIYPSKDGTTYAVTDQAKFDAIHQALDEIASEKVKIVDKIARLEQILGPGRLEVPTGYSEFDYVGRLKAELAKFFIHKIIEPGNGDRHYTLPETAVQDTRYQAEKAKIMPLIEASEAKTERERELAALANAILAES